jgi:hypothetical protein
MQGDHTILGWNISEWVAIVNAVAVVLLVFVNIYYPKIGKHQACQSTCQFTISVNLANFRMAEGPEPEVAVIVRAKVPA